MTGNEYQALAMKTASDVSTACDENLLLQGVMGMCGEAGEAIDIVKKHLMQGHPLDRQHIAKEIGDVLWYAATAAKAIGYDLDTIMQMNIDKLALRYGDRFDSDKSQHRKAGDV